MKDYKYLIVGGGMTADAAVTGIRSVDKVGAIGLFTDESHPPYARPPLSKGLWQGDSEADVWLGTENKDGLDINLKTPVDRLFPKSCQVADKEGCMYGYEKLLLATGGTPRTLRGASENVLYFRTLEDYRILRKWTENHRSFAVIGGGFIGCEIAAALAAKGKEVSMLFPEERIGANMFPSDLAQHLASYYDGHGVNLMPGAGVEKVKTSGDGTGCEVHLRSGDVLDFDRAVVGVGLEPNCRLAREAGLLVENGIVVDEQLRASDPHIFAAGDAAAFHNPSLQKRIRCEHEDNALKMGDRAGRNMAGEDGKYDHLPYFYSDMFDLGYEAIGELDADMKLVSHWADPFRLGVVAYLRGESVRGVLFWGMMKQAEKGRNIIASKRPWKPGEIHDWERDILKGAIAERPGAAPSDLLV